jgi:protein arginine kinase activator
MKCDVCDKEATVFLTQIINGQMTTVNLCDKCSKDKGVTDETGFGLAEAFLQQGSGSSVKLDPTCESCGYTAAQLKKIGRMGCPECYHTFRSNLDNLLRAMHKGTRHVGKRPLSEQKKVVVPTKTTSSVPAISEQVLRKNLNVLREKLDKAVAEERYEDAARLKKDMERIQNQLAGSLS